MEVGVEEDDGAELVVSEGDPLLTLFGGDRIFLSLYREMREVERGQGSTPLKLGWAAHYAVLSSNTIWLTLPVLAPQCVTLFTTEVTGW